MNYYIYYYFYSKKFPFLLFILNIIKFKNNTKSGSYKCPIRWSIIILEFKRFLEYISR